MAPGEAGVHGGRVVQSGDRMFELVFTPKQLRVYPFDAQGSPLSSKNMNGFLTLPSAGGELARIPLQFVPGERAPSAVGERRDYLEAIFDYRTLTPGQAGLGIEIKSGGREDKFGVSFAGFTKARELVADRSDDLPDEANPFAIPLRPGELPVTRPGEEPLTLEK